MRQRLCTDHAVAVVHGDLTELAELVTSELVTNAVEASSSLRRDAGIGIIRGVQAGRRQACGY
jgi:hypothetical protein